MSTTNPPITRAQVVAICEVLGHDANRVNTVTITPDEVLVTYVHVVTSDDEADDAHH